MTTESALAAGRLAAGVVGILLLTVAAVRVTTYAIDRSLAGYRKHSTTRANAGRVETMGALARSTARYIIYFVGFLWVLDVLGIPAGSVIAAAGIGGIAIGFGAQHLVRDVISGFFILMEDQYAVGEYVTIDGISGVVSEVGLRSTRIQAFSGDLHFIPNGNVQRVANHSRSDMRSMIDVSIGYGEDHNRAIAVAAAALEELKSAIDYITEGPQVLGIHDLGASGVVLRVWARARNMKQWDLEREMRRVLKEAFEREGIEIPFPQQVVILRDQRRGPAESE
jgi:small conductance mechanosensitive channel